MLNIVVIGDSIAKGVGSSDEATKSFGALIGEKVDGKVTNLGITGLDSGQLIEKLKTEKFQDAIEEADVILMSIGSNDLLKPFLGIVADAAGASGEGKELYKNLQKQFTKMSKEDPLAAGNALADAVKEIKVSKELKRGCEQFPENFETIVAELKEMNPEAVIYANNIYNPYYGVAYVYEGLTLLNIHELCEGYIVDLNKAFDRNSDDYIMMDMYSVFCQTGYTNVNAASLEDMSGINFDPHPNDKGYQLMADYIYTQMDSIEPTMEMYWEADEKVVPIDQEELSLVVSERVRTIGGKELYLSDGEETYTYRLTGEEELESAEMGNYILTLPLENFLGEEFLKPGTEYKLTMEEGAFKDKGNNIPEQLLMAQFTTPEDTKAQIAANSVAIVSQPQGEKELQKEQNRQGSVWWFVAIFVVIAVAIVFGVLYNRKRVKKHRERKKKK